MRQRQKKTLAIKKETIRHLELRPLSNDQLAQVAGGTSFQPRKSISCCCR